ncbi:MAG: response regulator transcription factor [Pseudomonadota bacterium]|nr:response regulator transcription factor [Pseudomonadota bacterium]
MEKHTILLADDHSILREGLRALLSNTADLEVIGEAEDGQDTIEKVRQLQPELVLLDLSMPIINGTEAIRVIKQRNPGIKIIALTVHKSEEYVRATLDAGADGYVLKDDTSNDLLASIRNVRKGKVHLSPGICDKVINGYLDRPAKARSGPSWEQLTLREREVLKLIAEGNKNRGIAECLSVSIKTVEKHRSNLMKKLDLHGVSALTMYAIDNGLVSH